MLDKLKEWILGETNNDYEVETGVPLNNNLRVGSKVQKKKGYPFPGVVVAEFHTTSGAVRYVVECTSPDVRGCLHIFNADQLSPLD